MQKWYAHTKKGSEDTREISCSPALRQLSHKGYCSKKISHSFLLKQKYYKRGSTGLLPESSSSSEGSRGLALHRRANNAMRACQFSDLQIP